MTFSYTCNDIGNWGNRKIQTGTATAASGDTSGDIATGLTHIEKCKVHFSDLKDVTIQTDITATEGTIKCTFSDPSGDVNILWKAIGW